MKMLAICLLSVAFVFAAFQYTATELERIHNERSMRLAQCLELYSALNPSASHEAYVQAIAYCESTYR